MRTVKGFVSSMQRELDAHPLFDQVRREEAGVRRRLETLLTLPALVLDDVIRETEPVVRDRARKELAPGARLAPSDARQVALLLSVKSARRAFRLEDADVAPAVLDEDVDAFLSSIELSAPVRRQAMAVVARSYWAFGRTLDDLERALALSAAPAICAPAPKRVGGFARAVLAAVGMAGGR